MDSSGSPGPTPSTQAARSKRRTIEEALADAIRLDVEIREFARRLTDFDRLLGPRGWISHGDLNTETADEAISFAKKGDLDRAEQVLLEHYSPETVDSLLQRMWSVEAFRPRLRLARLAADDFRAGRYHACVPVVLSLTDGVVTELHERRRGLFATGTDLNAWDSLATYGGALQSLAHLFSKGRRKPTTKPISVPYRHGIMHGMDLAYDNALVAAKAWAALFSVREWAVKAERGLLESPSPGGGPQPSPEH